MKTLLTVLVISLVINAITITRCYNNEELNKLRFEEAKIKYEQTIQQVKQQLETYDTNAINSTFNELFPNATKIDCTPSATYRGQLLQNTPEHTTEQ